MGKNNLLFQLLKILTQERIPSLNSPWTLPSSVSLETRKCGVIWNFRKSHKLLVIYNPHPSALISETQSASQSVSGACLTGGNKPISPFYSCSGNFWWTINCEIDLFDQETWRECFLSPRHLSLHPALCDSISWKGGDWGWGGGGGRTMLWVFVNQIGTLVI